MWYPAAWFAIANSFQSAAVNAFAAFQNAARSSSLLNLWRTQKREPRVAVGIGRACHGSAGAMNPVAGRFQR